MTLPTPIFNHHYKTMIPARQTNQPLDATTSALEKMIASASKFASGSRMTPLGVYPGLGIHAVSNSADDPHQNQNGRRDAYETGCTGLLGGWAIQVATGSRVHAETARKAVGPFYCAECYSDAIHRNCSEIRHHFAHNARLSPVVNPGESPLHRECKQSIFDELRQRFPQCKWVCDEVRIPAKPEKNLCALQPDIGGRIGGKRVAIEIQTSALTLPRLLKRSLSYSARGVSILWVLPLTKDIGTEIIRPRLFERYLHSIYFGRVYYWRPGFGSMIQPVHFGVAWRSIPHRQWHAAEGEEREGGGYEVPYKRIRRPIPHAPVSIADAFYHLNRPEHHPWNERKTVPAMRILLDKLPQWWKPDEQKILDQAFPKS